MVSENLLNIIVEEEKKSIDIISLYNSLSGQKYGSSENQSITNFFPMYFHDKRGINVESDMREESMMITNKNYYQEEEKWKNHNINALRVIENNSKCFKWQTVHSTPPVLVHFLQFTM